MCMCVCVCERGREGEKGRDEIAGDTRMQRGVTISSGGLHGMHRGDVLWRARPHRVHRSDEDKTRRKRWRETERRHSGYGAKYARTWYKRFYSIGETKRVPVSKRNWRD